VVEVDQFRLASASLDEAVGMAIFAPLGVPACDFLQDVVYHDFGLDMNHRSRLETGNSGKVTGQEIPLGDAL
jgi:hypothetical protein